MQRIFVVGALALALGGCAAAQTAISHRNLDVQSKMSATIFLDPIPPTEKRVFVQVRNTSDKPDLDLTLPITHAVAARGYTLVQDPSQTHYLLQVNVLQCGAISPSAAEQAFRGGYGSTYGGTLAGGAVGALASGSGTGTVVGAVVGGVGSAVADAAVKNVTYTVITDVQVSEITARSTSDTSTWKRYQTRVMSTANQVNLDFADALPELKVGISHSIAGIF